MPYLPVAEGGYERGGGIEADCLMRVAGSGYDGHRVDFSKIFPNASSNVFLVLRIMLGDGSGSAASLAGL